MSLCFHDQLLQTAHAYLNAHNDRDISSIRALCDQKSVHRAGPLVVKSPDRTNGEHVNFNEEVFKVLHTYHATITDVVANEVRKKVVLYVDARATADADEYENEYVITLAMTEDGESSWAV
jgi:hypothetical protein